MIQRPALADQVLARLTDAIVAHAKPRRVVLFGSRARGVARPDSDYDVMVELQHEPENLRKREWEIADAVRESLLIDLQITVRWPGLFERRRDDVGTIDYDIAREGIVLYADPSATSEELRPARQVRERYARPPESLVQWLEKAESNLRTVDALTNLDRVEWDTVAFPCQQAAEKYLKAALVNRHIRPTRTHDLRILLAQAEMAGYNVGELVSACAQLTQYAVDPRYPGSTVNATEGRRAVADCHLITETVKAWIAGGPANP